MTGCLHWIGPWLVWRVGGLSELSSWMWEDPAHRRQLHSLGTEGGGGTDHVRAEDWTEQKQAVFLLLTVDMM